MAPVDKPHPETGLASYRQPEMAFRQAGARFHQQADMTAEWDEPVLPAFIVDSAGVATPGNLVRGEGFTMRHGDVWPTRGRRRRLH